MEAYKKSEIAWLQLRGAISQIKSHNFVSALTLAGAANEVLVQLCRMNSMPFTHCFTVEVAATLNMISGKKLKTAINGLSHTKNRLKHHGKPEDEVIIADYFVEATGFINSSLDNYKRLFGDIPKCEEIDYYLAVIVKKVE